MWHSTRAPNLLQKHDPREGLGGSNNKGFWFGLEPLRVHRWGRAL